MQLSKFGEKFTSGAGIISLMNDLGRSLGGEDDVIMMGGGNPGQLPEIEVLLKKRLQEIAASDPSVHDLVGIYDPPQGNISFVKHCAKLLKNEYGWDIGPENICLTNGSQTAFFILFNIFAGRFADGSKKYIRLPLTPEYIGYSDLGLEHDIFAASRPKIEYLEDRMFKYRVDFDRLIIGSETGAICVSRPTNPTGNVITDNEISRLLDLACRHDVPLIIDSAYGVPFPGIIYADAKPLWHENVITCMSLSKLGLPAVRTGIIVAREDVVRAIAAVNGIISLAPSSFGPKLVEKLVADGEILALGERIIKPFYYAKCQNALHHIHRELDGLPYRVHRPEGSMFLWLWFEDLPITGNELYELLKVNGVLVVSGHYFFPGLNNDWKHRSECVRLTYSQDDEDVEKGIAVIGRVLRSIYERN